MTYLGPWPSLSEMAGCRRPTKPMTVPSVLVMGKVTRSRKRSMRLPVLARVATPAEIISSSVMWWWLRRWLTRAVQPAGVAGPVRGVGQVLAEPLGDVVVCPAVGEASLVEVGGELVDANESVAGWAVVPGVAVIEPRP